MGLLAEASFNLEFESNLCNMPKHELEWKCVRELRSSEVTMLTLFDTLIVTLEAMYSPTEFIILVKSDLILSRYHSTLNL